MDGGPPSHRLKHLVEHQGRMMSLYQLGRATGLCPNVLRARFMRGNRGAELVRPTHVSAAQREPWREVIGADKSQAIARHIRWIELQHARAEFLKAQRRERRRQVEALALFAAYPEI